MGKIVEQVITNFSGGLTEDKRTKDFSKYSLTKHFDAFTYPHKLVPYHKTEANETKANNITKFLYAPWLSAGAFRLYGFGSGSSDIAIVHIYDIDAGAPDSTSWTGAANNTSAVPNRDPEPFFYYKGFIYMWAGGNKLIRFDTTTSAAFNDAYQTISYTYVCQPVHHPADDIAYFFHDNIVATLNNTSFTDNVLTLPNHLKIVAATAYGNYLAIACITKGTSDIESVVFLWDRDSSLATLSERIDFGRGKIVHLATLDNVLTAVMEFFVDNLYSLGKGKVLIKQPNGDFAKTINELTADTVNSSGTTLPKTRMLKDNKLYFPMKLPLNSDDRLGIWVVDSRGRATLDFVEEEATSYQAIFSTANTWWIAHSGDGSVNRSDDNKTYSTTNASILETLIVDCGDPSKKKKLIGVTVMFEPLPTAGQVVLKYRKDEETSWTTLFTYTTDNGISHSVINKESNGTNLVEFKEIQFQILSTGGAVITGWKYKAEILDKDLY